jgi:hypothetical protein
VIAQGLRGLERAGAVEAVARARLLAALDARDGHLADGQRSTRTWLVHGRRVTRGQGGEQWAVQALARDHVPLLAGLRDRGHHVGGAAAGQVDRGSTGPGGPPAGPPGR